MNAFDRSKFAKVVEYLKIQQAQAASISRNPLFQPGATSMVRECSELIAWAEAKIKESDRPIPPFPMNPVTKHFDRLGAPVAPGDVLLEATGTQSGGSRPEYVLVRVWTFPENYMGQGITFHHDGKPSRFWWASVSQSIRLEPSQLPAGFLEDHAHGLSSLTVPADRWGDDPYEAIRFSGWAPTPAPHPEGEPA